MRGLLLMITFLTRIPIKYPYEFKTKDMIRGIIYMPVVGLIIGILLWGVSYIDKFLDKPVTSLILLLFYLWITGGLHIDGLADSADGFFSNRDKVKMLDIMKDSTVGAFGVLIIFIILISNLILLQYIDLRFLIILPIIGRCCALFSCSISEYARVDGLGKYFIENAGFKEGIFSILFALLTSVLLFDYIYILGIMTTIIFTLLIVKNVKSKIGGMTGDTIGYIIELTQTFYLFSIYLIMKVII